MRLLGRVFYVGLVATGFHQGCTARTPSAERVEVRDLRIPATPPGTEHGAAFMTLRNSGPPASLRAVYSNVSETIELHKHTEEDGRMRMRRVPEIAIPENAVVELKPGGLHIMFIGLKRDLKVGDTVALTLEFGDGSRRAFPAPVRSLRVEPTEVPSSRPHVP